MLRLKIFVFVLLFCVLNWNTGFASEQLKPADQEQAEFDNPVIPTEQVAPTALKPTKKAIKKQINKQAETKSQPEAIIESKENVPEHSPALQPPKSNEASQHSAEAEYEPKHEAESAHKPTDNLLADVEATGTLINSLDVAPPVEKNYGWIWFSVVALAILLLMFLLG